MIYGALAEIFSINGHEGTARSRDELVTLIEKAYLDNGTWAMALSAGNADEPMKVVATMDAGGTLHWFDLVQLHACTNCGFCWNEHELNELTDLASEADLSPRPTGNCPDCGGYCYPEEVDEHVLAARARQDELSEQARRVDAQVRLQQGIKDEETELLAQEEAAWQRGENPHEEADADRFDVEAIDEAIRVISAWRKGNGEAAERLIARLRALRETCEAFQPDVTLRVDNSWQSPC